MTRICSWCGRVNLSGRWVVSPELRTQAERYPVAYGASAGLCPECAEREFGDLFVEEGDDDES